MVGWALKINYLSIYLSNIFRSVQSLTNAQYQCPLINDPTCLLLFEANVHHYINTNNLCNTQLLSKLYFFTLPPSENIPDPSGQMRKLESTRIWPLPRKVEWEGRRGGGRRCGEHTGAFCIWFGMLCGIISWRIFHSLSAQKASCYSDATQHN